MAAWESFGTVDIEVSGVVPAPPHAVWTHLSSFGDLGDYMTPVNGHVVRTTLMVRNIQVLHARMRMPFRAFRPCAVRRSFRHQYCHHASFGPWLLGQFKQRFDGSCSVPGLRGCAWVERVCLLKGCTAEKRLLCRVLFPIVRESPGSG